MKQQSQRDPILDAVKGFLILCIVLEHNNLLTQTYKWIRPFCDAFAAGCFLIFTFAWPLKNIAIKAFINKYFSYYWPFLLFMIATTILNTVMFTEKGSMQAFYDFFKAIMLTSPGEIKNSSGFMYFWFLPCLCALYLTRRVMLTFDKFQYILAIALWLLIGTIDDDTLVSFPFSLHVISFIFILGLIYSHIHNKLIYCNKYLKAFSIVSFISCSVISYFVGWELFLAGGIIPSWRDFELLLFYSFFMLIAIPASYHLIALLPKNFVSLFNYLGKHSLIFYLFHPIVFIAFTQVIPIVNNGILSFTLTLALCMAITYVFKNFPLLNQYTFPQTLQQLITKRNQ